MTDVDRLDLLAQELGFVLKKKTEQRGALELLLRGKDVFCVQPTADCHSYLACVKKRDRLITHDFYLMPKCCLFQWIFFPARYIMLWKKRFDWANVNFGRLLNFFYTERSWHAYWFSLAGMICPLTALISLRSMVVLLSVLVVKTKMADISLVSRGRTRRNNS